MRNHPLVIFAVVWAALAGAGLLRRRWWPFGFPLRQLTVVASAMAIAAFCAMVVWYATRLTYFDPAEPTITAVASVFGAGRALYPALDAPERYAHIYGPLLFMAHASAMAVFGPSIIVSKAVGATAILASLGVGYWVFARRAGMVAAAIGTGASVLIYMDFSNATFWTRAEPLVMLCVAFGLVSTLMPGRVGALVMLGVATGVAFDLKISGPVYLGPAFLIAARRHGLGAAVGAAGVAAGVGVLPFLLPNVSFAHYLEYIQLSARNGLVAAKIRQNLEWAVFVAAPVAGAVYAGRDRAFQSRPGAHVELALAAGVSLAVISVIAGKPGGGPYHLLPCVPICAYAVLAVPLGVWRQPWLQWLTLASGLTAFAIAVPKQMTLLTTLQRSHFEAAADDLRRFADAHPFRTIAVGYSDNLHDSDARPVIVFRTRDYLLDAPAVQEYRLSGLDLPPATIRAIVNCQVQYWLIPSGGEAFALPNAYLPSGPSEVFSDDFRRAFLGRYERTGATALFDVWECRKGG